MSLISTPKKAVISTSQCLICAAEINSRERIKVFGRSQCNLHGVISSIVGGDLQQSVTDENSAQGHFICKKKCYPRLTKLEKMSSAVKTLEGELREEMLKNKVARVRIKRGLSQEYEEQKVGKSRKSLFPEVLPSQQVCQQDTNTTQYATSEVPFRPPAVLPVFMQPSPQRFTSTELIFPVVLQESSIISGKSNKRPENAIQNLNVYWKGNATQNNEQTSSQDDVIKRPTVQVRGLLYLIEGMMILNLK